MANYASTKYRWVLLEHLVLCMRGARRRFQSVNNKLQLLKNAIFNIYPILNPILDYICWIPPPKECGQDYSFISLEHTSVFTMSQYCTGTK